MKAGAQREASTHPILEAETAADLMKPNVVSLKDTSTAKEAAELLTETGFSGVPVVDDEGVPVGVVSRADLVAHQCERVNYLNAGRKAAQVLPWGKKSGAGHAVPHKKLDSKQVRDIMHPVIFSAAPDTPASTVIDTMLALSVHRLFVTEGDRLLGVISTIDILRDMRRPSLECGGGQLRRSKPPRGTPSEGLS
jgi:CBS domain-containing protein